MDFVATVLEEVGSHSFKGSDVLTVTIKFRECPFLVTVLATLGSDASIRKRAFKLVYLLINKTNVEPLTNGLIDYLEVSDQDFKGDLTAKICSIVEKLSPDKLWYIDQMLKVLCEVNYVKDEYGNALVVITNASTSLDYTVWKQVVRLEYGALWRICVTENVAAGCYRACYQSTYLDLLEVNVFDCFAHLSSVSLLVHRPLCCWVVDMVKEIVDSV
ncbi:AP-1 complex subunit gamma-2-like protein [Tanacetum coccineum]